MPYNVSSDSGPTADARLDNVQLLAVRQVFRAIDNGDTVAGLVTLESSPDLRVLPAVNSYLGYCLARERGQVREGLQLCQAALDAEPRNPTHYLNLGRVLLEAGEKSSAIATFWRGISRTPGAERGIVAEASASGYAREHALILQELRRLGIRKPPPFPSLPRSHPLNKFVGKLLARLGLR